MSSEQTERLSAVDLNEADRRGRHPLKELVQRARDPEWVADTALGSSCAVGIGSRRPNSLRSIAASAPAPCAAMHA